ncbi:ankyrin, partial [Thozetella sp. PMI_491]
ALEAALYGGQPEAANLLLGHGAELFGSELIIAIQQRLPSVVENLLSLGPSLSNVGEADETALEAAITTGQFEIAHLILANNDSIYDPGALCAAVHMAMFTGDYHIVENILACRSFSTVRDELLEGTALELAVAGNHEGLVISLINIGCEPTPACVLRASFDGSAQCLDILLGAGADINGRRFDTDTALQVAVRRQHKEAVQLLLAAGADINAVPSRTDGDLTQTFNFSYAYSARTALQAAVELGDLELMELLLDNGADINSPAGDDRGATALQLAAIQGFVGIAKTLLQRGADCNAPAAKHHGRTALQGAAEHGRIDMVQLLLDFGAEIYGSSRMQYIQAVQFALKNGHSGAVRILRT